MEISICLSISIDGFIACEDDSVPWGIAAWRRYCALVKNAEVGIVGRKSYELFCRDPNAKDLKDLPLIIVAARPIDDFVIRPIDQIVSNPSHAIRILEDRKVRNIAILGGAGLCGSFANEGLVNFIDLIIEPSIIGQGIPMFKSFEGFREKLILRHFQKVEDDAIQVRYEILISNKRL